MIARGSRVSHMHEAEALGVVDNCADVEAISSLPGVEGCAPAAGTARGLLKKDVDAINEANTARQTVLSMDVSFDLLPLVFLRPVKVLVSTATDGF